jgi:hypothetical protein
MRNRRLPIQALVGSCDVIKLFDELSQQPFKVTLAKHDHMIEHLSPQGSDESLDERILPRTSIGSADFRDVTTVQKRSYAVAVDAVIVPEEILGLQAKGHRFTQLLDDPIHVRMPCDRKAYDFTSTVIENKENIQRGEVDSRDREEIDGP